MDILKAIGLVLLAGIGGYAAGLFLGMWAVYTFSSNTHDKSVEAAMTGAFFFGPVGAILGAIAGFVIYRYFFKH